MTFVKTFFQFCMRLNILKLRTGVFFKPKVGSRLGFLGRVITAMSTLPFNIRLYQIIKKGNNTCLSNTLQDVYPDSTINYLHNLDNIIMHRLIRWRITQIYHYAPDVH